MNFKTIYTDNGIAAVTAAIASGASLVLTHMAVGDGNGNPTTPTQPQTALVRELYRHAVNRVYQDPDDSSRFTAELIIPASVGGFVMREIGVFNADGTMLLVGNLPDTYKPTDVEGAYSDAVVRLEFIAANGAITLIIDPNTAVATQTWIINNVTMATLLPGGTTGQIAKKASNADGDIVWGDPGVVDVLVDMIEENQTLAAAQTAVILTLCTTDSLALYIEGVRLRGNQWTIVDATHLTLASSYPAGTKLTAVQNEPAGTSIYPLSQSLNLSDVLDKPTARANLGVPSTSDLVAASPPGQVSGFARTSAPTGWLKCNGAAVSRIAYASLFAAIGVTFGAGDGFNTFNLPDYRGEFPRFLDDGRGVDPGRAIGSAQAAYLPPIPRDGWGSGGFPPGTITAGRLIVGSGVSEISETLESLRGAGNDLVLSVGDTRPRNVALLACIRY